MGMIPESFQFKKIDSIPGEILTMSGKCPQVCLSLHNGFGITISRGDVKLVWDRSPGWSHLPFLSRLKTLWGELAETSIHVFYEHLFSDCWWSLISADSLCLWLNTVSFTQSYSSNTQHSAGFTIHWILWIFSIFFICVIATSRHIFFILILFFLKTVGMCFLLMEWQNYFLSP